MENDLTELLRSVIKEELAPMNERLDKIEAEQKEMKQDVQGVKQDVQGITQDIQKINQDIREIKEDQHLIKRAVLDTNERVMKMESVLENQHKIIELLSTRSIQ
ncbi:MAG: hypothetical protein E6Z15_09660, partial [Paenibacillus macerans]|nr:hypothetical protein [Paenibacillus macerans]